MSADTLGLALEAAVASPDGIGGVVEEISGIEHARVEVKVECCADGGERILGPCQDQIVRGDMQTSFEQWILRIAQGERGILAQWRT